MNTFMSYPRSGHHWQELRMLLFLSRCVGLRNICITNLHEHIQRTHWGYGVSMMPTNPANHDSLCGRVFVLLRDAKAVLVSYCKYLHHVLPRVYGPVIRAHSIPSDCNKFVRHRFGVMKYAKYLNEVHGLLGNTKVNVEFCYYDDMFELDSVSWTPRMLGSQYRMTDVDRQFVFENSSLKVMRAGTQTIDQLGLGVYTFCQSIVSKGPSEPTGTIDSYQQSLNAESQAFVDDYFRSHVRLGAYRTKYLEIA